MIKNELGTVFKSKMREAYWANKSSDANLPAWVSEFRKNSFEIFEALPFPNRKLEDWKYTSLIEFERSFELDAPVLKTPAKKPVLPDFLFKGQNTFILSDQSHGGQSVITSELDITPLGDCLNLPLVKSILLNQKQCFFSALNASLLDVDDGYMVTVKKNVNIKEPINLVFLGNGEDFCRHTMPKIIINMEMRAKAIILMHFLNLNRGVYFTNRAIHINLEADANLQLFQIYEDTADLHHIINTEVYQGANSRYFNFISSQNNKFMRQTNSLYLNAKGAEANLLGYFNVSGDEQVDHHLCINHNADNTKSSTRYHGLAQDKAKATFNGKIKVKAKTKGVDASLLNHNLLLSNNAEINTKPELEIDTDDVKCTHGATVGQLDPDALFYLTSRGIVHSQAVDLLKEAFCVKVFEGVSDLSLQHYLKSRYFQSAIL